MVNRELGGGGATTVGGGATATGGLVTVGVAVVTTVDFDGGGETGLDEPGFESEPALPAFAIGASLTPCRESSRRASGSTGGADVVETAAAGAGRGATATTLLLTESRAAEADALGAAVEGAGGVVGAGVVEGAGEERPTSPAEAP